MIHAPVSPRLRPRPAPVLAVALLALAGCQPGFVHTGASGSVTVEGENASVQVTFGDRERRLIRDYYGRRGGGLPPGLAKKDRLPPGLQKQVRRNGTLPPGLRMQALPGELERRLEPVPDGYVRARVGLDVVLVDEGTRVIVDVIHDVAGD